jgi:hypothetical protein
MVVNTHTDKLLYVDKMLDKMSEYKISEYKISEDKMLVDKM